MYSILMSSLSQKGAGWSLKGSYIGRRNHCSTLSCFKMPQSPYLRASVFSRWLFLRDAAHMTGKDIKENKKKAYDDTEQTRLSI